MCGDRTTQVFFGFLIRGPFELVGEVEVVPTDDTVFEVLPQFVWRNYPEPVTFRRDSRDFKKALVARERRFGSRR